MDGDDELGAIAQNLLEVRATRTRFFPHVMFDEHAWEMLLHLFVAEIGGAALHEDALYEAVGLRFDSGRRQLRLLKGDGQVDTPPSGNVQLTDKAIGCLRSFLVEAGRWHTVI